MSKLTPLHSKLAGLRRRRAGVRWGTAWAGFGVAVIAVVLGAFLVDWLCRTTVSQRLVLWGAGGATLVWAWWRYAKPFLGRTESNEEVALFVERQQGIDSDLVAAMQFERDAAGRSGSPRLETAVVDYVAEFSPGLDVYEGLDTSALRRRVVWCVVAAVVVVAGALAFPGHARAFGNRMLLGRDHYPTETRIRSVAVNGLVVQPVSADRVAELRQRRKSAAAAQDRLQVELRELAADARKASSTSNGFYDSWFGPDEPLANTARELDGLVTNLNGLRGDLTDLDFARFDDPTSLLKGHREIARTLDELDADEALADLSKPIGRTRAAAHAAVAAVGRLVPTVPYGAPMEFRVEITKTVPPPWKPEPGRLVLTSLSTGVSTEIPLEPVIRVQLRNGANDDDQPKRGILSGTLPRMVDSVQYQVFVGDAFTDPHVVAVVPLPSVTVELKPTPPAYAADAVPEVPAGRLQQSVVEGSRVDLAVECTNKSLARAVVTVDEESYPLESDEEGRRWTLDVAGTPFADVRGPIRFEVTVEDADGLELERPIQGFLRLEPDRGPRMTADVKYGLPIALPNATRTLDYRAGDDYGLSRVAMKLEIGKQDGTTLEPREYVLHRVEDADQPTREISGAYTFDLAPLGLELGDELKITFEATDFRGTLESETTLSEPIAFRIASEAEVLREMQKHDVKAEQALDAIQRRELGIGESP